MGVWECGIFWARSVEGVVGRAWLKLWADLAKYNPLNRGLSGPGMKPIFEFMWEAGLRANFRAL